MTRKLGYATLAVLRAIGDGADYGLDVMERTDLPSGTVYPTLGRLEKRGYVRSRWESDAKARSEGRPRRRYYRVTGEGAAALAAAIRRYEHLLGGALEGLADVPRPEES